MEHSFVFAMAGQVLGKLSSPIFQELSLVWGVRDELCKLENTVSSVHALLLDAEEQQASNHQLRDWLGKLKDALYHAENVLEEFEIDALHRKMFDQSVLREVHNLFSCVNLVAFRFKMGHKIKKIRQEFDEIAVDRNKFNLIERFQERDVIGTGMTHSFGRDEDVIGRDDDREDAIRFLMDTSDHESVTVLPIVGLGGMGKTTLAKMVYNDNRVVAHFDLRIWACISVDFELDKVIKKILKSVDVINCNNLELEQLQKCLREKLDGHKYLLILDDVWNENRTKWIELRNLLMGGASGSKIIVTTRSKSVASNMTTFNSWKEIQGLSHEECLSLFLKFAFRSIKDADGHRYLVEIAREIVKKCKGVPLAVKTLGNLLYMDTQESNWIRVRDNDIWQIKQEDNDILPALKLSYHRLPTNLRRCFAFCSIFPKDHKFNHFELIYYWSANGLLQQLDHSQGVEDVGMKYIEQLSSRGFFQELEQYGVILYFKMHDLVHDLALLIAESDCTNLTFQEVQGYIPRRKVRHLFFSDDYFRRNEIPSWLLTQIDVRTIRFPYGMRTTIASSFIQKCISKFKYLRYLDVSRSSLEVLPSSIGNLKHLKFLALIDNHELKSLPTSISKLVSLETLNFSGCSNIEKLPRGFGKLTQLRNLAITTKELCLAENEFQCMTSLRLLCILECPNMKFLLSDEALQQLSALETLTINGCDSLVSLPTRGLRCLTRLKILFIADCSNLDLTMHDHSFNDEVEEGGLRSLQNLLVRNLPMLAELPLWLVHGARNVKHISIFNCNHLTNIMSERMLQNFKSLQKLWISACPQLVSLPEALLFLTALNEIRISNCPELTRRCQRENGEDWQKISHVANIFLNGINI